MSTLFSLLNILFLSFLYPIRQSGSCCVVLVVSGWGEEGGGAGGGEGVVRVGLVGCYMVWDGPSLTRSPLCPFSFLSIFSICFPSWILFFSSLILRLHNIGTGQQNARLLYSTYILYTVRKEMK